MTNLYLLRHGETEENVRHILQGHMPGTLTERGRQQAVEAARALADIPFDAILSSDLKRCVDTAELFLSTLNAQQISPLWGIKGELFTLTPLLRERDWGSATGMLVDKEHRIQIPPDVESVAAIKQRARIFLGFVAKTYPDQTVLAISHGLFCRFLQAVHYQKEISDIQPMHNTEFRLLTLQNRSN